MSVNLLEVSVLILIIQCMEWKICSILNNILLFRTVKIYKLTKSIDLKIILLEVTFMKFIIPQNYDFSSKLFGIIDYSTVIFNVIWCLLIFCISNFILTNIYLKFFTIIVLCFPVLLFSIIGFNHENILYVLFYILKFVLAQKVYLYK